MNEAQIVGGRITGATVTVRTPRGDEYILDLDETAKAVATLLSDLQNERRMGWTLNTAWYVHEIGLLAQRSRAVTTPDVGF